MSRSNLSPEELELDQIRAAELELARREKEFAENRKRIARERIERESTMPPLDEIRTREKMREHEKIVSRGEVANKKRDQNRSLMLLFMLVAATCTLIWWGVRLMQGG